MPSAENRATSVQPNFGRVSATDRGENACAAGWPSPGSAPAAKSVTSHVEAVEDLTHVRLGLGSATGRGRSGSSP